jgi:CheY-like chemotaxis protein
VKLERTEPATILLVENNALLRNWMRMTLCGEGYSVLAAANRQEAAELAACFEAPLHAILARSNETELAARFESQWAGIRVVFISDATCDELEHHICRHASRFPQTLRILPPEIRNAIEQALRGLDPPGIPITI